MGTKIWAAMKHADGTEGRGPIVPHSYWTTKALALLANSVIDGPQGSENPCSVKEFTLCDRLGDHPAVNQRVKSLTERLQIDLVNAEESVFQIKEQIKAAESARRNVDG